jgi:predicted nucleotidyltransferase
MIFSKYKNSHQQFASQTVSILKSDENVTGVAVAGSWITAELDVFSDLDLIIVTAKPVGGEKDRMIVYANRLGNLLNAFTGEHVGEPRLLICLYSDPLLHVDLKFVTIEEFGTRIENPVILLDRENQLQNQIEQSEANFPHPDYQWIEDRFWTWIHYGLLKVGRGEYFEALDFMGYLRTVVFGPLLHLSSGNLPRGVRKVELQLNSDDLAALKDTLAGHDKKSIMRSIHHSIDLYQRLRQKLFANDVIRRTETEKAVIAYYGEMMQFLQMP